MEPELQEYYEGLLDMFTSKGWDELRKDFQETRDMLKIEYCNTVEDFWKAKGKAEILDRFLGYEEVVKRTYDEIINAQDI